MITTLKESRKHIETTREVSQRAAEAACAADDAANQLQTLGDGMELLIQSLEEKVQGHLRGKAPECGKNPNRDREVDHEAEKARRRRDRQRMPRLAGPSTRSGPREPSATIEQDSDSTCWHTEEETDCELDAHDRENIREGIHRSKKTYNEQEVLKAVTQQSLREMMKSDADSVSTTTSTHISLEHKLVEEAYTVGIKGEAFDKLIESARIDKDIVNPPVQQDMNSHVPRAHRQIQAIPHAVSLAVMDPERRIQEVGGNTSTYVDGVAKMVRAALGKHKDSELDKSMLAKAGVKLPHPVEYAGRADLEEFENFVSGILRWLCMNSLLGPSSTELQLNYLGTRLKGEAMEWYTQNIECHDQVVIEWNLESAIAGLQQRFLHALTHRHASNKFDMIVQGTRTVQELLNDITKYAAQMIHPPDEYTIHKRLHDRIQFNN
ncbi:hypothetical protein K439DRAFT_1613135 [Ramaria rubella]|nr:hypothetical protein K439DRAFT_1613135 [Ramaria rubella]